MLQTKQPEDSLLKLQNAVLQESPKLHQVLKAQIIKKTTRIKLKLRAFVGNVAQWCLEPMPCTWCSLLHGCCWTGGNCWCRHTRSKQLPCRLGAKEGEQTRGLMNQTRNTAKSCEQITQQLPLPFTFAFFWSPFSNVYRKHLWQNCFWYHPGKP